MFILNKGKKGRWKGSKEREWKEHGTPPALFGMSKWQA